MDELTSDSPTMPSALSGAGGAFAGRYQPRARLGRGATKEVYLAYDTRLDREVALAIVVGAASDPAAARARATREAQVTGRLGDHPNIITVYDSGEQDGVPYLVLRAMPGGSLADRLERSRPSIDETIFLGRQIALALAHAHAHGVVHRDVKPDNVWLAADGSAALGDFGIARQDGLARLTAEGVVVGTVRYLSPEQIRGAEVGPAADLYALGVTLYELVTGRPPYTADDPTAVLTQHLTAEPVAPSQYEPAAPAALELLILELLQKLPERRPPSAAAVAEVLGSMGTAEASAAAPVEPAAAAPRRTGDARRLVSVLAAGADIEDPEALHAVFERCTAVIERHGGAIEHYLGDALVALFGVPESRDDDALRAVRAAVELRAAEAELRIGIESGELFLGTGPRGTTIATGAAITAAGRLAERAAGGEILVGERMRGALADEASFDEPSGRLLELQAEQPGLLRVPATPFVGRVRELDELHAAFAEVRDERICRIVTVAGPAGIGKSRLAGEFVAAVGDGATVLAGRCLAYGEGTTYRALAEIVRGLGDDPRARVEELLAHDEQAVRGILGAIGLSDEPAQVEETAWALRRLLERVARDRPLVVAVEDIHWAQPALLDLLDHVVALSSGSPILLVCLTRPELLESRPAWATPQPNRTVLMLDALGATQSLELAELLGARELAMRIAERAEGNPLFVEQLVAVDAGHDGELPASIQAVLTARIGRLDAGERMLLQRAAVEGRTFHAGALQALLPETERRGVHTRLVALARKGLIGADRPEFAGQDAFRFSHALVREAAYAGLPKLLRAELHAGVAAWLEQREAPADEIVGYHLEQACVLAGQLGRSGDAERAAATRAVDRFKAAARSALGRGDAGAATALFERAIALRESDGAARSALRPMLGAALMEAGDMPEAVKVLDRAIAEAQEPEVQAHAQVEREFVRLETETGIATEGALRIADAALPVLDGAGNAHGRCRALSLRAKVAWLVGQIERADEAWRDAEACAREGGDERELFDVIGWRATAAVLGPTHVDEAIERCTAFRERVAASPVAEAWTINPLAVLHAMRGEPELAAELVAQASETLRDLGNLGSSVSHLEAMVRMLAGQPERAEQALRADLARLERMSATGFLATTKAMLAQAVYAQGRRAEAGELCLQTADDAAPDDIVTQVIWRSVQAKVLAHQGRRDEAEALARAAIALVDPTDLLSYHGDALLDLAEVLRACDRGGEAEAAIRAALALYERKGNAAFAAVARSLLAAG